jgi:L-lactate dehydrogenase complex protein LldF
MEVRSQYFAEGVRAALKDPQLQRALSEATGRLREQRAEAFASFPPGDALRAEARRIKLETLASLEQQLEIFAERFEARGGVLHRAADADEACRIVIDLVRARGGRLAVKSKSMTSEEIALNEALEAAGVETLETDLGEYIIQLAGEAPSHIIVPAIHKSVRDVAELFREHHGSDAGLRHEALTREARKRLREAFLRADVGITGANFAVAETGSLAIVENEGNVRMATSLPRLHIAVMGMEKVIPDLASLAVFLRILARSATGQKMTSYVSLVSGPRRSDEEDGPEELHLVVLDNGRSRLLADPELREALACIRCGACLNACPVYQHAGGHAYGWVYPGPIGAVINPSLVGHEKAGALPFASSLCGACREVCPVGIDLPRLLLAQRARVVESGRGPGGRAGRLLLGLYSALARRPFLYRGAARLARWATRPWVRGDAIPRLPGLGAWTRTRDLPAPARRSFRERWEERHG